MPLTMVGVGESRPIIRIGGSDKVRTHLENLGFIVGATVSIVNTLNGSVIVNIKGSRVALSEGMARKIMI